jgi:superfamily II DNA or RNA helicase
MLATFRTGDSVLLDQRPTRVIAVTELFGETYLDVFVEPGGPLRRVPASQVRPLHEPFATLLSGETLAPARFVAQTIAHQLRALVAQSGIVSAGSFRVTPLPHQILAVDFVLNGTAHGPRCLIADEVGLGKTIEAALVYQELKMRGQARRVLVIAPSGLTMQWRDELQQKFDEPFAIYDRPMIEALRQLHGEAANVWKAHDRIITSLDFIKPRPVRPDLSPAERTRRAAHNELMLESLREAEWDVVIFDEAHKLSKQADGTETARFKVADALAGRVPVLLFLTATPHQGDPARFFHLLKLLDEHRFVGLEDLTPDNVAHVTWRTRKRAAVDASGQRLFKQRITDVYPVDRSGLEHAAERELYAQVTDYVRDNYDLATRRQDRAFGFLMILFQRLVTSSTRAIEQALDKRLQILLGVRDSLAPIETRNTFDEEEAGDLDGQTLLDDLLRTTGALDRTGLAREIDILADLLQLARRAAIDHDAKLKALLRIVEEVCQRERDAGVKFLVFTEFVATQEMIVETLRGLGYAVELINGSQSLPERIQARKNFAEKAQFLVSTDAGGEGINLQFCHVVVNYDLPWNPMKLEQRIGRVDRIGQTRDALVFNLLIEDTVERRVREVLEEKLALIRQQFGEDKLADILSTPQDEFNFDRLFIDAVIKRQAEAAELEDLAQQIYQRAQAVLEGDDLLLPQSQTAAQEAQQRLLKVPPVQMRSLVVGYLAGKGQGLHEYARRSGVYYFDCPTAVGEVEHYGEVVFDQARAVEDDALTLLHLNHPFVRRILAELDGSEVGVARLQVPGLSATQSGMWALYRLAISDNAGSTRHYLLPFFLDDQLQSHPEVVRRLMALDPLAVNAGSLSGSIPDRVPWRDRLQALAETAGREKFLAEQLAHNDRLDQRRAQLVRSYRQQEQAIDGIAIENIREARRRDLAKRRTADLDALGARRTLVPDLKLLQLAWVETA